MGSVFFRYYGRRYLPDARAGGLAGRRAAISAAQSLAADLMLSSKATAGQILGVVGACRWLAPPAFHYAIKLQWLGWRR